MIATDRCISLGMHLRACWTSFAETLMDKRSLYGYSERLVVAVYIFMLWLRFTRLNWRNCHKFANIAWTETTKTTKMRKSTNVGTLRVYFYIHIYLYAPVYICDRYEIYISTYVCIFAIETNSNEYRSGESWNIVSYPATTRWEFQKTGL